MDERPARRTSAGGGAALEPEALAARITRLLARARGGRVLLGMAGEPGAGKSTIALALLPLLDARAAIVPLDGFHLADVEVVLTEGNYLLLDRPEWRAGRALLDETWYVDADPDVRRTWLVGRHVRFGKPRTEAERWVAEVDEANAALVGATRSRADLVVEVSSPGGSPRTGSQAPTDR